MQCTAGFGMPYAMAWDRRCEPLALWLQTLQILALACSMTARCHRTQVDGKPVGPQRVWPGGLAMGRTLGDASAGAIVTCEPEARQVLLNS